jgi:signal transduction histidine kinase
VLETRIAVAVVGGPALTIRADGDQLDQLLINLVTNAADATLQVAGGGGGGGGSGGGGGGGGGRVEVGWERSDGHLDVFVRDEGPGLPDSANLFVPFFTTKPSGSGIGLALSRQIAEGHGGTVTLANRVGEKGCEARLRLPIIG